MLAARLEDGKDISKLPKATVQETPARVRKWAIAVVLPQPAAALMTTYQFEP
jgi:hypothetical protein